MGDTPSFPLQNSINCNNNLNSLPSDVSNEFVKYYSSTVHPLTHSTPEVRNSQHPQVFSTLSPYLAVHPQLHIPYYQYGFPGIMYSPAQLSMSDPSIQYFQPSYQFLLPPSASTSTSSSTVAQSSTSFPPPQSPSQMIIHHLPYPQVHSQNPTQLPPPVHMSFSRQTMPNIPTSNSFSLPLPLPPSPPPENNQIEVHSNSTSQRKRIVKSFSNSEQRRSTKPTLRSSHSSISENDSRNSSQRSSFSKSSFASQKSYECELTNDDDAESSYLVTGRILSMSQDQAGCKILQKIAKRGSQEDLEIMYQEIAEVLVTIFKDVFGNYFFQCLYEQANSELKHKIVESVSHELSEGAKSCYGTRSIQCLIKHSSEDIELYLKLKSQLLPNLYELCTDRYGNHCIKQLMMSGTYETNIDIVEFLKSRWYEFCIHQYCTSVMQTCFKTYPQTLDLAELILGKIVQFIQNEFATYVIQCILHTFSALRETICRLVISCIVSLSKDKYASMVLQDCVRFASEDIQAEYVREILSSGSLLQLSLHKYSNFVIQEALSVLPLYLKSQLVDVLQPHKSALESAPSIFKHIM